jgi:hypothetical protein
MLKQQGNQARSLLISLIAIPLLAITTAGCGDNDSSPKPKFEGYWAIEDVVDFEKNQLKEPLEYNETTMPIFHIDSNNRFSIVGIQGFDNPHIGNLSASGELSYLNRIEGVEIPEEGRDSIKFSQGDEKNNLVMEVTAKESEEKKETFKVNLRRLSKSDVNEIKADVEKQISLAREKMEDLSSYDEWLLKEKVSGYGDQIDQTDAPEELPDIENQVNDSEGDLALKTLKFGSNGEIIINDRSDIETRYEIWKDEIRIYRSLENEAFYDTFILEIDGDQLVLRDEYKTTITDENGNETPEVAYEEYRYNGVQ